MSDLKYGFSKHLPGVNIDAARERVTTLLATEGFGVLTHVDVAATLKKKIGADFRPYHILGACNPALAHKGAGRGTPGPAAALQRGGHRD